MKKEGRVDKYNALDDEIMLMVRRDEKRTGNKTDGLAPLEVESSSSLEERELKRQLE